MNDDLPTEFDVIVVGTGLVESIIAAASSRIGKKVLHLDGNFYYGQLWATLNLEHFEKWFNQTDKQEEIKLSNEKLLQKNTSYTCFETLKGESSVSNLKWQWFIPNDDPEELVEENNSDADVSSEKVDNNPSSNENLWSHNKLKKCSQKFNIDLSPKVIFSKGPMVDLIIKSGVTHYVDFVSVHNVLLYLNSVVEAVPYSKSDVFSTRSVSVVEKRLLMKLLLEIQNYNLHTENEESKNETFHEFLKKYQISESIEKYIIYAIARVSKKSLCDEGIKAAKIFLNSLGVYGNSPYLWPLYGSSELAQAFCRLCAVYGGIYCLNRPADAILTDGDNKCVGILSENKELFAQNIVMTTSYTPSEYFLNVENKEILSRAILITDQSLYLAGKKGVSIMQIPFEETNISVTLIELDSSTNACPSGLFIVHLITSGPNNDFTQFDKIVQELFVPFGKNSTDLNNEKKKPTLLFKLYFNVNQINSEPSKKKPDNFYSCTNPVHNELDFFSAVKAARTIFEDMYPGQEFPPTPTEISVE